MGLSSNGLKVLAYIPPGGVVSLDISGAQEFGYTFTPVLAAALPTASAALKGARAIVSDVTTGTFAATLSGGGSLCRPVFCDGTNWVVG